MNLDEFIKICRDLKYEKGLFNPNTKYEWMKSVFEVGNPTYYINKIINKQPDTSVLDRIKKDKKFASYFKNYIYETN
jgi:hypothetical protein